VVGEGKERKWRALGTSGKGKRGVANKPFNWDIAKVMERGDILKNTGNTESGREKLLLEGGRGERSFQEAEELGSTNRRFGRARGGGGGGGGDASSKQVEAAEYLGIRAKIKSKILLKNCWRPTKKGFVQRRGVGTGSREKTSTIAGENFLNQKQKKEADATQIVETMVQRKGGGGLLGEKLQQTKNRKSWSGRNLILLALGLVGRTEGGEPDTPTGG